MADYLWDGQGTPAPDLARLERTLGRLGHDGRPLELRLRAVAPETAPRPGRLGLGLGAAAMLAVVFGIGWALAGARPGARALAAAPRATADAAGWASPPALAPRGPDGGLYDGSR